MIKPLGIEIITPDSERGKEIFNKSESETLDVIFDFKTSDEEEEDDSEKEVEDNNPFESIISANKPSDKNTDNLGKTNPLYRFAKTLYDEGLIELEEDEDLTKFDTKQFKDRISEAIDKKGEEKKEEYVKNFSGARKVFLGIADYFDDETEAIQVSKDLDLLERITDETIEEDEKLAEFIVAKTLASKNFSRKDSEKMIEDLKDLGKLTERAVEFRPGLKTTLDNYVASKKTQRAQLKALKEKQDTDYYNDLFSAIDESEEILPGLKMTERTKKLLKEKMMNPVYTDEKGRAYNDLGYKQKQHPKEFNLAIEMLNSLGLFEFDKKGGYSPDLSKISKLVETKVKTSVDKLVTDEQQISRSSSSASTMLEELKRAMGS